jgi:GNAT superfamily N-acetyltransferase
MLNLVRATKFVVEDLFVRAEFRRKGIGKVLGTWRRLLKTQML